MAANAWPIFERPVYPFFGEPHVIAQRKHVSRIPLHFLQVQGRNECAAWVVSLCQASRIWGWSLLLRRIVDCWKNDGGTSSILSGFSCYYRQKYILFIKSDSHKNSHLSRKQKANGHFYVCVIIYLSSISSNSL